MRQRKQMASAACDRHRGSTDNENPAIQGGVRIAFLSLIAWGLGVAYWAPRLAPGPRAASDNPLRHRRPAGWCCSARPSCPSLARDPSGLRRSGPTWPAAFAGRWALDSAQARCCLTQPGWPQPTMLSVSSWSFLWVSPRANASHSRPFRVVGASSAPIKERSALSRLSDSRRMNREERANGHPAFA
jgi:hypothetical protein